MITNHPTSNPHKKTTSLGSITHQIDHFINQGDPLSALKRSQEIRNPNVRESYTLRIIDSFIHQGLFNYAWNCLQEIQTPKVRESHTLRFINFFIHQGLFDYAWNCLDQIHDPTTRQSYVEEICKRARMAQVTSQIFCQTYLAPSQPNQEQQLPFYGGNVAQRNLEGLTNKQFATLPTTTQQFYAKETSERARTEQVASQIPTYLAPSQPNQQQQLSSPDEQFATRIQPPRSSTITREEVEIPIPKANLPGNFDVKHRSAFKPYKRPPE